MMGARAVTSAGGRGRRPALPQQPSSPASLKYRSLAGLFFEEPLSEVVEVAAHDGSVVSVAVKAPDMGDALFRQEGVNP